MKKKFKIIQLILTIILVLLNLTLNCQGNNGEITKEFIPILLFCGYLSYMFGKCYLREKLYGPEEPNIDQKQQQQEQMQEVTEFMAENMTENNTIN